MLFSDENRNFLLRRLGGGEMAHTIFEGAFVMRNFSLRLSLLVLLGIVFAGVNSTVSADDSVFQLSGENPVSQTLNKNVGKKVTLKLASGVELKGKVSAVGDLAVRVSELEGQEFFDAWVRLDDIAAILVRVK